jgi:hypothetical protein
VNDITDYALPLITIERLTKEVHDLCLEHEYDRAKEAALRLGSEARVLQHTLTIMKEKEQWRFQSK